MEEASPDLLGFSASKKNVGTVGLEDDFVLGRLKASASGFNFFFSLTENQRRGVEVTSRSLEGSTRLGVEENGSRVECWCGTAVRSVARC